MRRIKSLKLVLVFILMFVLMGYISTYSKEASEYYDDLFASNEFTLYTEEQIDDDVSLYDITYSVLSQYGQQEYWNSSDDNAQLYLGIRECTYNNMKCTIVLNRAVSHNGNYENSEIKEYSDITINIDSNIDEYFPMVENNNIVVNYDESMFNSEEEKNNYVSTYLSSFGSYSNNNSINFYYDSYSKIITRTEYQNSLTTKVVKKAVNGVVFSYTEDEFSNEFKKLTSGTITIKSDTEITGDILSNYLTTKVSGSNFSTDGNITNNKVYIKLTEFKNGTSVVKEKHLITLVQDTNIDTNIFKKVGYETSVDIEAEEPTDGISDYINDYFNMNQLYFDNDDGSESYRRVYSYGNYSDAIIEYVKNDTEYNCVDVQYHKVSIRFIGYSNTVSDSYKKKIGENVVVNADHLDSNTINAQFNFNARALGCNADYSYCDIALYDYKSKTIEIHKVAITLDDSISDVFIKAFGIKDDGTIDIVMSDEVNIPYSLSYSSYDEKTQDSIQAECYGFNASGTSRRCELTFRNYVKNITEKHDVLFNIVDSQPTVSYKAKVNESVEIYPGETEDVWNRIQYSSEFFAKDGRNSNVRSIGCNTNTKKCTVVTLNSDNKIELHEVSVSLKEGRSPEFDKFIPGNTLKINSIYKDDPEYLRSASMGYLMSTTKTWSYLDNFANGKAQAIYNGIETHTINIEYADDNVENRKVVEDIAKKIDDKHLQIKIDDLEFLNNFYYNDSLFDFVSNNYNSKTIADTLNKIIDDKHVTYAFAMEGGLGNSFVQVFGGKLVLYYDGIAYATTKHYVETVSNSVVYIPDNTTDTREEYIKAAQKRIDDYFGKNSGVVVKYGRELDPDEIDPNYMDAAGVDGNVYVITYKNKEAEFLIIKNSSKMKTSTFNAIDVNNNVSVSSSNANYPANTVVSSNRTISDKFKQLLKQLGLTEAEIIDIDLYSPTLGNIDNFANVDFDVTVPINLKKIKGNKLYAYYISDDGKIEVHPVELDEFLAKFKTSHFSTYVISDKVLTNSSSLINPNTGDGIVKWVVIAIISAIGVLYSAIYMKKIISEK